MGNRIKEFSPEGSHADEGTAGTDPPAGWADLSQLLLSQGRAGALSPGQSPAHIRRQTGADRAHRRLSGWGRSIASLRQKTGSAKRWPAFGGYAHRAFFRERIGKSFSFNVACQQWLKTNTGKTYGDAIAAYHRILAEKKQCKTTIYKQFEYNTYIRTFFEDNPGRSLTEAIACWNHKKSLQGHHRYERSDLAALDE